MSAGVLKYTVVVRNPDTLEAVALLAGQPVPDWAEDLVHEDDFEADDTAHQGSYSDLKKAELEAEVDKRNADREADKQIVVGGTGKVADLVTALEADDTAHQG